MRKLLLFAAIAGFSSAADAQKIQFTDTSNHWTVRSECSCDPYGYSVQFTWGRDTTIHGLVYRHLGTPWPAHIRLTNAWVREDPALKKVFLLRSGLSPVRAEDSVERVLYDYKLVVGDTVRVDIGALHSTHYVHSIDSTTMNGISHRVWHFMGAPSNGGTLNYPYSVIEGIGATRHPLFPGYPLVFENREWLYCFRQSKGPIPVPSPAVTWELMSFDNSCKLAAPDAAGAGIPEARVVPNPVSGNATIVLSQILESGKVQVFDPMGRCLYSMEIHARQRLAVPVDKLTPGAYYFMLTDDRSGARATGKFTVP